ncbi:MAG: T9SS type A sorting domain-containing protein [Bacteroidales bacterium]|nr:T9SS type A sorting domain-containing protein [Bacteroidales bacterium]
MDRDPRNACDDARVNVYLANGVHYSQVEYKDGCIYVSDGGGMDENPDGTSNGGSAFAIVTPLLTLDFVDNSETIVCVDTDLPVGSRDGIKVKVSTLDPDWKLGASTKDSSKYYHAAIEYALASTTNDDHDNWFTAASALYPGTHTIRGIGENHPEFLGKELKFRIRQSFNRIVDSPLNYYSSKTIQGIFYLEKPSFTVSFDKPICYYDETSITINNLPYSESPATLRVDIKELATTPDSADHKHSKVIDGVEYYWNDAVTKIFDIPQGNTSVTVNSDASFSFKNGIYAVQAIFYDGSQNSLCSKEVVESIYTAPLILNLNEPPAIGSSSNNIGTHGGTCQLSGSVEGEQGSYSLKYEKNGGSETSFNFDATNFSAGTYNFWVTDSKGCKSAVIENVELTEPEPLDVTVTPMHPDCHASNTSSPNKETGQIGVTINKGGIDKYKAVLYDNNNIELESISDISKSSQRFFTKRLSPGNYKVKVFNYNTYQAFDASQAINSPALLKIDNVSIKDITCIGASNGEATITASGGTPAYTFGKSAGDINDDNIVSALSPNDHIFYVKDNNDCIAKSTPETVSEPGSKLTITPNNMQAATCDREDGSVLFDITGGWANDYPYEITINTIPEKKITLNAGKIVGVKATGLSEGTYEVKVSNKSGCIATNTFKIPKANPLTLTASAGSLPNCTANDDGSIVLTIGGGSGSSSATYELDNPAVTFNTITKTIGNLRAGVYNYTVTDERGCTASSGNFHLNVRPDPIAFNGDPTIDNASCSEIVKGDGRIIANATGGKGAITYGLSNGQTNMTGTFEGLKPDTYKLIVTDEANCSQDVELTVGTSPVHPINMSLVSSTDKYCDNGKMGEIVVSGSYTGHPANTLTYSISPGANEKNYTSLPVSFNGLDAGTYTVKLTDSRGCSQSILKTINNKNYTPQVDVKTLTDLACSTAQNGVLEVKVTDYTGDDDAGQAFTYSFKDTEGNELLPSASTSLVQNYSYLTNQAYSLTVTDAFNCEYIATNIKVDLLPDAVKLTTPITTQPTCQTASNGSIEVSAGGGVALPGGEYVFYLIDNTDAANNQSITGTSATFKGLYPDHDYTIGVKDAEDCADEKNLGMPGHLDLISISDPHTRAPLCYQDENGKIALTIANTYETRVNYSYELFKADADGNYQNIQSYTSKTEEYNGLGDGRYMIKVSGDDNCSISYPGIDIIEPQKIVVDNRQYACISTNGQSTGWFSIDFKLGSLHYDVEWILPDGSKESLALNLPDVGSTYEFKRENLGPGEYTFRLKDRNNCDYFDTGIWYETSVIITQPEPLEISFSKVDESCADYDDGQITVSATGGWLCPTVEHTDCRNPAHANCPDWVDYTCGTQDYVYAIDGGDWQCSNLFTGLSPATYSISVMDKAGNITTTSLEILARPKLTIQPIDAFPASCPGYNNGRIVAAIENGVFITDHLDYTIREKLNGELVIAKEDDRNYHFGQLSAGTYTLQVTDLNGCVDEQDFTIAEPEAPEITINHNYIRQKGEATGEIDVEVIKGNGVFNYQWYKDAEAVAFDQGQSIKDITLRDLLAGTYTLKVQDTALCVYEAGDWMERQVLMREPQLPLSFKVVENTPVSCNGLSDGVLEVSPIGGWGDYTFAINAEPEQKSPRYEDRPAANYTITVTDSAGISWQQQIDLLEPDVLTASLKNKEDIRCFEGSDGSIELDIKGGNLAYQVSVDNTQWLDGTKVPDLPIGTYTVFVQDPKNCLTQVDNITLSQPAKIELLDSTIIKSRCSNNEGQIFSSYKGGVGNYTYKWQKGIGDDIVELPYVTADISDLYSGLYTVEVRDEHDCPMSFNFPLGDITDLAIESIDVTDVSCWDYADGQAQASVVLGNPAYTYTWSQEITSYDQDKAWGMKTGTYYLMVTDEKNCNAVKEFTVGTPDSLYFDIVDMEHPLCLGGVQGHIEIQGTGGTPAYQYSWSTGSEGSQLSNVVPGEYVLGISDAHNCYSQFTIPFDYQRTVVPYVGKDTLICHYDELPLNGGDYAQFKWTSINGYKAKKQQVVLTEPDTYFLEVRDNDQCLGFDTITLDVSYLQIANLSVKDVTCNNFADGGAQVEVSPSAWAHTIQWTDGSADNSWLNLSGGDYFVKVYDAYGCEDTRDFTVYEPDALAVNVNKLMLPLCYGVPDGRIELEAIGGVGNYRYEWLHDATKASITKLDTGTYVVDVYDDNNCHLRQSYEMEYVRTIYPQLGEDLTVCEGNNAKLYPGEFFNYQWYQNDVEVGNDTALIVSQADTYWVEVRDESKCIGRDTMSLSTYATEVTPEFLTATSVAAGDTLIIVEVTQPKPQHIAWSFTGEYQVVEQGDYFCKVIFTEQGMREVTLNAHTSDCFAQARKTILVTPPGTGSSEDEEMADTAYQNLLKLGVTPNPTDGFFTVSIELSEKAPVNIYLVSLGSGKILEQRDRQGMDIYSETYNLSIPGVYVVVVESNGEKRVGKVIVK